MLYNNINRTHHASDFYAQPGGTFSFVDYFMYQYPKQSLTIEQQMQPIFDKILSVLCRMRSREVHTYYFESTLDKKEELLNETVNDR